MRGDRSSQAVGCVAEFELGLSTDQETRQDVSEVEAMLRGDIPPRGVSPPADFIPLGGAVIIQRGEWVMARRP